MLKLTNELTVLYGRLDPNYRKLYLQKQVPNMFSRLFGNNININATGLKNKKKQIKTCHFKI